MTIIVNGGVFLGVVAFIIYVLKNPEKLDKWSYLFNKYWVWKNEKTEKKVISTNLDYKITSVAKKINNEAQGILPFGIRINWKNPDEVQSYVQKNEVIVVLKKEDNSDKNIVEACNAFVPKALLPKARNCIDPQIIDSIDQYVIKKILNEGNYSSAYNFFLQNIFSPRIEKDDNFKEVIADIDKLDSIGFFTRIMLDEFRKLGEKLYGTLEESEFKNETRDFLEFLRGFSRRKPGDMNTRLLFNGSKIKIAVIFVAKRKTLNDMGIDAHILRIGKNRNAGVHRIFIFSYAQQYEKYLYDENGYVINLKKKKKFVALNQLEGECRKIDYLRLVKKQKYFTKDVSGNKRSAKYLLYEIIR